MEDDGGSPKVTMGRCVHTVERLAEEEAGDVEEMWDAAGRS
jgi:hypothetical protein